MYKRKQNIHVFAVKAVIMIVGWQHVENKNSLF